MTCLDLPSVRCYTKLPRWIFCSVRFRTDQTAQSAKVRVETGKSKTDDLQLTNAEFLQLRIRVIALEDLVIALLSEASERQRAWALELATTISPKPGFTPHRLTIHAATQMIHLSGRASLFGIGSPK